MTLHHELLPDFVAAVRIHPEVYEEQQTIETENAWKTIADLFEITGKFSSLRAFYTPFHDLQDTREARFRVCAQLNIRTYKNSPKNISTICARYAEM